MAGKIHDPFMRHTVLMKGWKHAWNALFGGIKVEVAVDGSQGAQRAVMTLNPHALAADSVRMAEERMRSRMVHVAGDLTPEQIRGYRLMDNRSNEETSWDSAVLSMELGELKGLGFDMAMTGFSIGELNSLVPTAAGLTEDDAVPAPPDTPVTVLGDCWLLGPNHRVLCGDSTSVDAVARLCAPGLANLVFTDPPYNVDYEGYTRDIPRKSSKSRAMRCLRPNFRRSSWPCSRPTGPQSSQPPDCTFATRRRPSGNFRRLSKRPGSRCARRSSGPARDFRKSCSRFGSSINLCPSFFMRLFLFFRRNSSVLVAPDHIRYGI